MKISNLPKPISELMSAPLPQQTATYTVISHGDIDYEVKKQLLDNDFVLEDSTEYRSNYSSTVASGTYFISYQNDPELSMMMSWINSYDKTTSFGFAVGAYNRINKGIMVPADSSLWSRVHTGNADQIVKEYIRSQISNAKTVYDDLVKDKQKMLSIKVNLRTFSELIGRLYFEHGLLNNHALSTVKTEFRKPSFIYSSPGSLWFNYCHIVYALRKHSHPSEWLELCKMVHFAICQDFDLFDYQIEKPKVNPNQIDLEDSIAEIKAEKEIQNEEIIS